MSIIKYIIIDNSNNIDYINETQFNNYKLKYNLNNYINNNDDNNNDEIYYYINDNIKLIKIIIN